MAIYYPREDSYLLEKYSKRLSVGSVLDMCTGTGIQALAAAKSRHVKKVLAVDISKQSIDYAKKNSRHRKIKYKVSDMFSKVPKQRFDTIICNPPYLPQEKRFRQPTTEGGKKGWEFIEKFLEKAGEYLKIDGNILLLFSSLTNKKVVEGFLAENLFNFKMVDSIHYFFEELYVYNIIKSSILRELEKKGIKDLEYLAKGKRGVVYTGRYRSKNVAVKIKKPESRAVGRINNEIKFLKLLNKHKIGPKLVCHGKNWLAYEFVKGEFIKDWVKKAKKSEIKKVLKKVFSKCYKMDRLGINKEEMHHPLKHIIVGKSVKMIDFERARFAKDPKNVSQFCQFAARILKSDAKKLSGLIREYKKKKDSASFKAILKELNI